MGISPLQHFQIFDWCTANGIKLEEDIRDYCFFVMELDDEYIKHAGEEAERRAKKQEAIRIEQVTGGKEKARG